MVYKYFHYWSVTENDYYNIKLLQVLLLSRLAEPAKKENFFFNVFYVNDFLSNKKYDCCAFTFMYDLYCTVAPGWLIQTKHQAAMSKIEGVFFFSSFFCVHVSKTVF